MNRLLICIILLLTGHTVLAEKLYRWVEPDGSITFSPTPPPAGTDYKTVNAAHNNAAKAGLPESTQQNSVFEPSETEQTPSILATSEHGLDVPGAKNNANETMAQPTPEVEVQKLSYAPDTGSEISKPQAINNATPETGQSLISQIDSVAVSKKRRDCQDLNKRVLSLERRLRAPLTPVEMDNTVVAMARYQRNYDQHCVE